MKNKLLKILLFSLIFMVIFCLYYVFLYRNYDLNGWYLNNKYIGHALYGIDNYTYTNSLESLEYGYSMGIRIMEVDLLYTSDGKIVANHYWNYNKVLGYDEFINNKIYNKYTPMDLEMLIDYLVIYDDLYLVIDTKEDDYSDKYIMIYKQLIDYCKMKDVDLLKRIIVQIYDYDMYYDIHELYEFDNYIFSIYKMVNFNILKLTNFCIYHDIDVIAFPEWLIENGSVKEGYIKFIKNKGLKVYVYTVNDNDIMNRYFDLGVDGIYTDNILG